MPVIREIVLNGQTNEAPYELTFNCPNATYVYGASYGVCQKCLSIDKRCKYSGKKAMNFIKKLADYCIAYENGHIRKVE